MCPNGRTFEAVARLTVQSAAVKLPILLIILGSCPDNPSPSVPKRKRNPGELGEEPGKDSKI